MTQDTTDDISGTTHPYLGDPIRIDASEDDQKSATLDRFQTIVMRIIFIIVYGILMQIVFIFVLGILWIMNFVLKSVKWATSAQEKDREI